MVVINMSGYIRVIEILCKAESKAVRCDLAITLEFQQEFQIISVTCNHVCI